MSHEHYPLIAPVVEKTAKEFNLHYSAQPSWWHAVMGYYDQLYYMSKQPANPLNPL